MKGRGKLRSRLPIENAGEGAFDQSTKEGVLRGSRQQNCHCQGLFFLLLFILLSSGDLSLSSTSSLNPDCYSAFIASWVGFDYRHPVRPPVPVSPDTVILLPTPSTRYRHPVLDDGYWIIVEFWCSTG